MGYKVIHEDDNTFKVQHPDGSHFSVAKRGLTPSAMKRIKYMYKGGYTDAEEIEHSDPSQDAVEDDAQAVQQRLGTPQNDSTEEPVKTFPQYEVGSQQPVAVPMVGSPQSQAEVPAATQAIQPLAATNGLAGTAGVPGIPTTYPDILKQMGKNESLERSGIQGMAKSKQDEAASLSSSYKDYNDKLAQYNQTYQNNIKQLTDEYQNIASKPVDPNHYWNSLSTGNQVQASIGLFLGALGSSKFFGGNPNYAYEMFNKSIERDMEAQKENKNSLLNANRLKFHNEQIADQVTRLQMNAALEGQIKTAAAQQGSDYAMNQAKVMIGQIQDNSLNKGVNLAQQMTQIQTGSKLTGAGGQTAGIPESQMPPQAFDNKELAKTLVKGPSRNGERTWYRASSEEGAKKMAELEPMAGAVTDRLKQLEALGPAAAAAGTEQNQIAQSLIAQLKTQIPLMQSTQIGAKRISPAEAEEASNVISDPTSVTQLLQRGVRTNTFFKNLINDMEEQRAQNYIGYRSSAGDLKTKRSVK